MLEITSAKTPRAGDASLPQDTPEPVREWAESEEAKVRENEELVEKLSAAMEAEGYDTGAIKKVMNRQLKQSGRDRMVSGSRAL